MKNLTNIQLPKHSLWAKLLSGILLGGLLAGLTGCRTTKQVSESPKDFSGFLGDYSMLKRGGRDEADFIYIDQANDWARYTRIYVKNVELWKSEDPASPLGRLSAKDQQKLVDFYHTAIVNALQKNFQIVDAAGPDTLVIHAAITEGHKSRPVLNLVSTVYPETLVISYVKQMFTGAGSFVGKVRIEGDFTDGATGRRVAAVVDMRAGTKALRSKFNGSWGDVELCATWWANRLAERLELAKQHDFRARPL